LSHIINPFYSISITGSKVVEDHGKLYDDVPNSAVDLQNKDRVSSSE